MDFREVVQALVMRFESVISVLEAAWNIGPTGLWLTLRRTLEPGTGWSNATVTWQLPVSPYHGFMVALWHSPLD